MRKSSWAGRALPAAAAALLALGAAGCGNRGDNAANTAANTANRASNVASNVANAVSNATAGTTDTALRNKVEANLTAKGLSGITVTVANGRVTLKGNVPRAKLQDALQAAHEASPSGGVDNQLNAQ